MLFSRSPSDLEVNLFAFAGLLKGRPDFDTRTYQCALYGLLPLGGEFVSAEVPPKRIDFDPVGATSSKQTLAQLTRGRGVPVAGLVCLSNPRVHNRGAFLRGASVI